MVTMVTPDLVDRGLHAGNMVRDAARIMGGGGGGQPEMAQAGGRQADKLGDALRRVAELVREACSPWGGEMRYLALDLGNRRIGLAVGGDEGVPVVPGWTLGKRNLAPGLGPGAGGGEGTERRRHSGWDALLAVGGNRFAG